MPEVYIKTPNLDDIFEKWKQSAVRKDKKKLEKQFGTKGAVFSINNISAAETVKETKKEAAIYFAMKKRVGKIEADKKNTQVVPAPRLKKETFYVFKGQNVNKDNWKGDDKVPMLDSIKGIPCKKCSGKGFIEDKCGNCKGSGKIEETWKVLEGEEQNKVKKVFDYPCNECYGTGKSKERCGDCGGHKYLYEYKILPVPFKTVVSDIPVLHSSAKTKYEREMESDLHKVIQDVEGIKFKDFKELEKKAEPSLGYWNKAIKKTINVSSKDYSGYMKDDDTDITTPIYLFPMIQLSCETKKGKSFEVYSIGSGNKFMIFSDFA